MLPLRCLMLWLTAVSLGTSIASAQPESADEVIAKAIENRLKITSYDVEMTIDFRGEFGGGPDENRPIVPCVRYYRDGEKLRNDFNYVYEASERVRGLNDTTYWYREVSTPELSIECDNALRPDKSIGSLDASRSGFFQRPVQVHTDPRIIRKLHAEAMKERDLRSLGFSTVGAQSSLAPIDDFFRLSARSGKTLKREVLNGAECLRVDFTLESGVECSFWFDPGRGYAPVKARGYYPPFDSTDEIELTLKPWKDSGIWFPSEYRSTRKYSPTTWEIENATVIVHSINQPLAKKTFELEGLQLSVGRRVSTSKGSDGVWDGEKVVPEKVRN